MIPVGKLQAFLAVGQKFIGQKLTCFIMHSMPVYGLLGPVQTHCETKMSYMKLLEQILSLSGRN